MAVQSGGTDFVVNSLLCFVSTKYRKVENSKLANVVCGFYTADEVCLAKQQLLADIKQRNILDREIDYLTHTDHLRAECDTDDIFDMLLLVSEVNLHHRLPTYVTDNSEKVPTMKLEDGDFAFLLRKFDKMEAAIKSLYDAVHTSLSAAKTHMSTTAGKPAADAITTCTCKPRGPPTAQASDDTQVVNTPQAPDVHRPSGKTANVNKQRTALSSLTETEMLTGGDADCFRVQESSRRRRRRIRKENQAAAAAVSVAVGGNSRQPHDENDNKSRKYRASASAAHPSGKSSHQPLLVGTHTSVPRGNSLPPVTASRISKAVYCVDNVHKSIDKDAFAKFVSRRLGVRVLTCFAINPRLNHWQRAHSKTPDCSAFRICIYRADNDKFMDATKWPADITVSRWYTIHKDVMPEVDSAAAATDDEQTEVDNIDNLSATALNVESVAIT